MKFGMKWGYGAVRKLGGGAPTQWDFNAFTAEARGTGQAEIVSATVGRSNRIDGANAGVLWRILEAGQYRFRADLTLWSGLGNPHLRAGFTTTAGDVFSPTQITPDAGGTLYFAAGPVDFTWTFASEQKFVLRPSSNGRSMTLTANGVDPILEKIA